MKSFLLVDKRPIIKWNMLPDNVFYEGNVPEGYSLAVSPSENYIVIDVDVDLKNNKNGFLNIPSSLKIELDNTFNYITKRGGRHYWFKYTGEKSLGNKTSVYSIDLRTNKGYVVWYPKQDVRECLHLVNKTSKKLNVWLEELFSYV